MLPEKVYQPRVKFDAAPTLWDFLRDDSFFTGVEGPLGSGKSVVCCSKIMKFAGLQAPNERSRMRHTRWAIIRNTYPELRSTTINTWLWLFPEQHCGGMRYLHPITHRIIVQPTAQAPGLDCEVLFMALDRPGDVKHLKSLDLTGAWVNEASEVPEGVIDMLTGRVGRYPPEDEGGATWAGIIADTNATDDTNWWHRYSRHGAPATTVELEDGSTIDIRWSFYRQPPALLEVEPVGSEYFVAEAGFESNEVKPERLLEAAGRYWYVNPDTENLKYLRAGYYHQQVANKTLPWIRRFLQAKSIYYVDGKAWVPEYSDEVMTRPLKYDPTLPLVGGLDVGGGTLNPAAVVGQRGQMGDWRILYELSAFDTGLERFSTLLKQELAQKFGEVPIRFWMDPAAAKRDEVYETAVEAHMKSRGFDVLLAGTNDNNVRRNALALPMGRMIVVGGRPIPGFLVDPSCTHLRAALSGKWYRRRVQTSGMERFTESPEKNEYSHIGDATSYMCMGGGEHAMLTRAAGRPGVPPSTVPQFDQSTGTIVRTPDFNPLE
ncbi:MAG: hypothetical protein QNJ94_18750 [Alphaproteobacteria bacterium]|nr:hypothetical protein [Alphaproteobacteria bacterium]